MSPAPEGEGTVCPPLEGPSAAQGYGVQGSCTVAVPSFPRPHEAVPGRLVGPLVPECRWSHLDLWSQL